MKYFIFIIVIFIGSCKTTPPPLTDYTSTKSAKGLKAAVVSAHPIASDIGLEVLKMGGNAIDAAIAVHHALAVTLPAAGNIGGGGFLVYRSKEGDVFTLDFREKAPLAAYETMYQDSLGELIPNMSTLGHMAVGVPGATEGMALMYERFSKLKDWNRLIQPSIDVARFGFAITEKEAEGLNSASEAFGKANDYITPFQKEGGWKAGDLLIQKHLANTLTQIRDKGRAGFYEGEVADLIIAEMQRHGGLITKEDLKGYKAIWRSPIATKYGDYTIYSMPPPSSGGVVLSQLLESIEPFGIRTMGVHTTQSVHLMVEAERRAYADRSIHLGDPDYYNVPVDKLIDSIYINQRMQSFNPAIASKSVDIAAGQIESEETTHFTVIDEEGNAVSLTTTLNTGYGSKVVVKGAGFILNNEMDDFSSKPGTANFYGLIGAEANKIESGKRMLSSMTPTIITKGENLFMTVGTPGGSTIITSVFQTLLNVIEFGMTASEAVALPRFHHQWLPDEIMVEDDCLSKEVRDQLALMGHSIRQRGKIGRVEAIVVRKGGLEAGADPRGDDDVSGY